MWTCHCFRKKIRQKLMRGPPDEDDTMITARTLPNGFLLLQFESPSPALPLGNRLLMSLEGFLEV
jgi:hypothetical protein